MHLTDTKNPTIHMQNYGNNKCRILNSKFAIYIINVFMFLVSLKLKRKELGKAGQRRKSMIKKIRSVGAKLEMMHVVNGSIEKKLERK